MSKTKKIVKFSNEVRDNLKQGVATLSDAVKVTMGPKGKVVLIEQINAHPIVTKDGVTVAKAINLKDPFQNLAVQIIKDAASRSAEEAGDGTTTATVLTQAIFEQGLRMISSGVDSVILRKSIEHAVDEVIKNLKTGASKIKNDKELEQIAMISCNGEQETATLINNAISKVGIDGSVLVEEAKGFKSELSIVEGVQLERGYLSSYFVTDSDKMHALLENCFVFLANKKLDSMKDIVPVLEAVLETEKPVLVVANDIDSEVLQALVVNRVKGALKVCAIKSPGFGSARHEMLTDLATLTNGKVFDDSDDLSSINIEDLGRCRKVIVKRSSTLFVANKNVDAKIKERIKNIKARLTEDLSLEREEAEMLKYRIRQLQGGVAVLRVGASTEAEMIERRDRVDDALHATRAALEEGIVAGGGVSLVRASSQIQSPSEEYSSGYAIVRRACLEPLRQIVKNTGKSPDLVVEKIIDSKDQNIGYNARTEKFGDLYEMGVIDPLKVVRCALQNACSAAVLLLTTECAMVENLEE